MTFIFFNDFRTYTKLLSCKKDYIFRLKIYIFEFSYVKPDSCILYICMYHTEIKIVMLQKNLDVQLIGKWLLGPKMKYFTKEL